MPRPSSTPTVERIASIGAVFSLSGPEAVVGAPQRNGAQLAADEINATRFIPGTRLRLLVQDDHSDPTTTVERFRALVNENHASALVGPTRQTAAPAVARLAQQRRVPALLFANPGPASAGVDSYVFHDALVTASVATQIVQTVKTKLGLAKVALLYDRDNGIVKEEYQLFRQALLDGGVRLTAEQTFATGERDVAAQLTVITRTSPDAIVVSALAEDAAGLVTQARQLGLPEQVRIIGGGGFSSPALIQNAGAAAEGVIVAAAWNQASPNPKNQEFIKRYQSKFSSAPDQLAAQAYSGVYLVANAIKNAGSTDRAKLRDALANTKDFETALGEVTINPQRAAERPAVVQVVKNGAFQALE